MKITKKRQFELFKKHILFYQELFGLKRYEIFIKHEPIKYGGENPELYDTSANSQINEPGKFAVIRLNSKRNFTSKEIVITAAHEMIHVLLHKLRDIGECRYLNDGELVAEEEEIVRVLEKFL